MDKLNLLIDSLSAQLAMLLILAGTVERITEFAKLGIMTYTRKELPAFAKQIMSLSISVVFCLTTSTKFNVGLDVPIYVNEIIAGLIISFGSDTLHSVLNFIKTLKDTNEAKATSIKEGCATTKESQG